MGVHINAEDTAANIGYLSALKEKVNNGTTTNDDKITVSIEINSGINITTVSVSTPLSCDFLPDCIFNKSCSKDDYDFTIDHGNLVASVKVMRQSDAALDELLEIISVMVAKTSSMKMALEVLANG